MYDIFKVMIHRSRSRTTFSKNLLLWYRHTYQWLAIEDHLVSVHIFSLGFCKFSCQSQCNLCVKFDTSY